MIINEIEILHWISCFEFSSNLWTFWIKLFLSYEIVWTIIVNFFDRKSWYSPKTDVSINLSCDSLYHKKVLLLIISFLYHLFKKTWSTNRSRISINQFLLPAKKIIDILIKLQEESDYNISAEREITKKNDLWKS
jgi:hypothetical protein